MKVEQALTVKEINEVKQLVHKVNHIELGKHYLNEDPTDSNKDLTFLFIREKGEVIAALRCTMSNHLPYHQSYWAIEKQCFAAQIAVVDRLVVRKDFRKSRAMLYLSKRIYELGIKNGVHFCLIESNEGLVSVYNRMGFNVYREKQCSYGKRYQMYLNLWDLKLLEERRSPFLDEYKTYLEMVERTIKRQPTD